ncbi:MAG: outer membrane lipid asymmetry maintenance protein MlaD [Geminicoccaceae bacterium]
MTRNFLETILGAVVLVVAVGFLFYAYQSSQVGVSNGYALMAQFDRVDGLDDGADVRVGGIKVGSVTAQKLDAETYRAQVSFTVQDNVKLPLDTSAAIMSDGLLGGKYLSLEPGGDIDMLASGDEVTLTQSSVRLEDLIGQLIYSGGSGSSGGDESSSGDAVTQ